MTREITLQTLQTMQNDRFLLSFSGECPHSAVVDSWSQLLDTVYKEVHPDEPDAQTEFYARLLEADNWSFDNWDLPYCFQEDIGEMSSMTIYRINSAVVPGSGTVGESKLKEPLTDEIIAKLGGKEATAGSGFKFWDFEYARVPNPPHDVCTMLRVHSPQCQPGEGAGIDLYDKQRGNIEGLSLFNNYCHTVGELLDLLKALKIRHANLWE